MPNKAYTREEVLSALKDGGELWYFYLDGGGVAIHDKGGKPVSGCYCPTEIFLTLEKEKVISWVRNNASGCPFSGNNSRKSVVYSLTPRWLQPESEQKGT